MFTIEYIKDSPDDLSAVSAAEAQSAPAWLAGRPETWSHSGLDTSGHWNQFNLFEQLQCHHVKTPASLHPEGLTRPPNLTLFRAFMEL